MAQAKWLVLVDWNDNGDFSDSNEDVTSDVLGLTLEHFRELTTEYVESARLELELKNDDHKYSSPNGSSPLSGNLKPGRKVWVRAAYPYDSFSAMGISGDFCIEGHRLVASEGCCCSGCRNLYATPISHCERGANTLGHVDASHEPRYTPRRVVNGWLLLPHHPLGPDLPTPLSTFGARTRATTGFSTWNRALLST